MRRLAIVVILVLMASPAAALSPVQWDRPTDANSNWLDHLPAPAAAPDPTTAPVRPIDLNPAGAPCILSAPGANGLPVCATPLASLSVTDPISSTGGASPTLGLKFTNVDLILTGPGALEVAAFTGAITKAAGATSTIFGSAGPHTVLANLTGGSAVPTFTGPATGGQFLGDSGWASVPTTSITGLAAIATSGSASDLIAGTVPAARVPTFVGAITTAGGTLTTAFGTQTGNSFFGVAGGSTAVPAAISCATPGTFAGNVAGTLGCTSTVPATSAPLAAGAVGFGDVSNLLAGDAANFHWDAANDRLGLRTATPGFQFQLVDSTSATDRGVNLLSAVTSTTAQTINLDKANGTPTSPTIVSTGSSLGTIQFRAYDGTHYLPAATIETTTFGTPAANNVRSELLFNVAHAGVNDPPSAGQILLELFEPSSVSFPAQTAVSTPVSGNVAVLGGGTTLTTSTNMRVGLDGLGIGPLNGTVGGVTVGTNAIQITSTAAHPLNTIGIYSLDSGLDNWATTAIGFENPLNSAGTQGIFGYTSDANSQAFGIHALYLYNPVNSGNPSTITTNPIVIGGINGGVGGTIFKANIFPGDGSELWSNSTAATAPAGTGGIATIANKLSYSENGGGSWTTFDSLGGGITSLNTDVVATGPGAAVATIQPNVVTNAKLRTSGALSLVGRSANSSGNVADISATAASGCVYRESGSTLGCGSITEAIVLNLVTDLAALVPKARTLTMTAPMTCDGGGSCDLSADRTIATPVFAGSAAGLVPASAGGTTNFLRADGTYAVPSGTGTSGITQLTGDGAAGPGSGSQGFTLATVNANVGSFTFANITVNAKGLVTAASSGTVYNQTIQANGTPQTQEPIFNFDANFSLSVGGGKNTISLGGPLSPSNTFGSAGQFIQAFTTDASGRVAGATPTNFPAATELLIAASGAAPVGDSTLTFSSSTKVIDVQAIEMNGTSIPANVYFIGGHTTNQDRDRVQFFVGAGSLGPTGTGDGSFIDIIPTSTAIRGGVTAGIYSTERIHQAVYTGTGQTITEAASLYIDAAPTLTTVSGQDYAIHVAAGPTRLDGSFQIPALGFGGTSIALFDGGGTMGAALVGNGFTIGSGVIEVTPAENLYYMESVGWAGSNNGGLPFTSDLTGNLTYNMPEVPIGFLAGHATLTCDLQTNNINAGGSISFGLTLNGSLVAGSFFAWTNASSTGHYTASLSTGSGSATDTYSLHYQTGGVATSPTRFGCQLSFNP